MTEGKGRYTVINPRHKYIFGLLLRKYSAITPKYTFVARWRCRQSFVAWQIIIRRCAILCKYQANLSRHIFCPPTVLHANSFWTMAETTTIAYLYLLWKMERRRRTRRSLFIILKWPGKRQWMKYWLESRKYWLGTTANKPLEHNRPVTTATSVTTTNPAKPNPHESYPRYGQPEAHTAFGCDI